jgi:CTP:molybdopterin cytidylyltransferase MocA
VTVAAIVLAAGASTRMGAIKPLLPLGAHSLLQRVLQTLTDASVHTRILALGPPHGEIIAATVPQSLPIAWNPDPQRGMLSSLQLALALLPPEAEGTLVWPADIPLGQRRHSHHASDPGPRRAANPHLPSARRSSSLAASPPHRRDPRPARHRQPARPTYNPRGSTCPGTRPGDRARPRYRHGL